MRIVKAVAVALLAVSWLCGCESTTSTTDSEELTYAVSPNPATAEKSSGVTYTITADDYHPDRIIEYPWKTTFTVTMQETGGVGREINSVALQVQQAQGGVVLGTTGDTERYTYTSTQASSNRIEAHGNTRMTFVVWYDLPNKGNSALVTLTFSFTDDDDFSFTEYLKVQVQ